MGGTNVLEDMAKGNLGSVVQIACANFAWALRPDLDTVDILLKLWTVQNK